MSHLILMIVVVAYLFSQNNRIKSDFNLQTSRVKNLVQDSTEAIRELNELNDRAFMLDKQVQDLLDEKNQLISARDSVQRLLDYTRVNERNARVKIGQLQKQLKDLQGKLDDVQQKYNDLLASSGTSSDEYKKLIQELTAERNSIAQENQRLQRELLSVKKDAESPIFALDMSAVPGELKKGRFSASRRSQNTDRVEVTFKLSRAPKPTENLIFKVFDATNQEIPVKPLYRNELNSPADPTDQKITLEFEIGFLDRRAEGVYVTRLYLTDVNKGVEMENKPIGFAQFEVK
ncbi:MAG: hypothetical protein AAFU64_04025 [Bacteroidota bacterium]